MSIYTISDLHLPFGVNKPMDIFGKAWENYTEKIAKNWKNEIKPEDTIVLPGDLSWATYLKDAYRDFEFLNKLPGNKIITKGNHDYFFSTLSKMNSFLKENKFDSIRILQNNYFFEENILICGTRGWDIDSQSEDDMKILNREVIRLELSMTNAKRDYPDNEIYVFLHYPPLLQNKRSENVLLSLLEKYNVKKCFYGHLHSKGIQTAFNGENNNVIFSLVSADALDFKPQRIV